MYDLYYSFVGEVHKYVSDDNMTVWVLQITAVYIKLEDIVVV